MRQRTSVRVVDRPQPQLVPPGELERIRCAARSGVATPAEMLAVLDHVAIQDRVIHAIAARTEQDGTDEERARVRAALEALDENPSMHVRMEFDCSGPPPTMGLQTWLDVVWDWPPAQVGSLATDDARVTITWRGQTETWRAAAP